MTDTPNTEAQQTTTPKRAKVLAIRADKDLQTRVAEAMKQNGVGLRGLAKHLDVSHASLKDWLANKRTSHTLKIEAAVPGWLQQFQVSSAPFVATATSERILSTLAYAQAYGDLVTVYGGPGVGKTRTITHFRAQYENVWIATMTPSCAAVVPALEELAEAVGIHDVAGGARRLNRAIRSKVAGVKGLIIIDEAQHLNQSAIEEIRSLHDWCEQAGMPVAIALVGNETVYARLTGGNRAAHFAQLYSRIGMKLYLERPSKFDVHAIAKHYHVEKEGLAILERIATRPGALRGVVKVCRLAGSSSTSVTAGAIRKAADNLGSEV